MQGRAAISLSTSISAARLLLLASAVTVYCSGELILYAFRFFSHQHQQLLWVVRGYDQGRQRRQQHVTVTCP